MSASSRLGHRHSGWVVRGILSLHDGVAPVVLPIALDCQRVRVVWWWCVLLLIWYYLKLLWAMLWVGWEWEERPDSELRDSNWEVTWRRCCCCVSFIWVIDFSRADWELRTCLWTSTEVSLQFWFRGKKRRANERGEYMVLVMMALMVCSWVRPSAKEVISSADRESLLMVSSVRSRKNSFCKKKQILSACSTNSTREDCYSCRDNVMLTSVRIVGDRISCHICGATGCRVNRYMRSGFTYHSSRDMEEVQRYGWRPDRWRWQLAKWTANLLRSSSSIEIN